MELSPFGKSALALAQRGWYVFPLRVNSKIPPKGWDSWESRATNDPIEVTEIWSAYPDRNIGLATGPSGLCVLDFDSAKAPNEKSGIENFRQAYPGRKLPGTYTVRTAGGGWHLYYRQPGGLRNSAGKLAERVDTRGQGGYVVAPGSVIDGNAYQEVSPFDEAPTNLPELPDWIASDLLSAPVRRSEHRPLGDSTKYALAALRGECEALASTGEGGRNHAANRAAWNVSRFVARGELDQGSAFAALETAALECGLPLREAQNAIESGLTRGIAHYS